MAIPRNLGNLASGADSNGVLGVTKGGTGRATLTANNVVLGNGTSQVGLVAPGTTGNILVSNGTTWTSAAPAATGAPIGALQYFQGTTTAGYPGSDWLQCNGGVVLQTSYSTLYSRIGLIPNGGASYGFNNANSGLAPEEPSIAINGTGLAGIKYLVAGSTRVPPNNVGAVSTSTDGITWNPIILSATNIAMRTAKYLNGLYIAAGNSGTMFTSTNAITWNAQNPLITDIITDVIYGTVYVACSLEQDAGQPAITTSTDAITWTQRTVPFDAPLYALSYNAALTNGKYVAVGGVTAGPRIYTSTDAITWTNRTAPGGQINRCIAAAPALTNKYAIGAEVGILVTSTDGVTWTSRTSGTADNIISITFGASRYAYLTNTSNVGRSTDGITWSVQPLPTTTSYASITFAEGQFRVVASNGSIVSSTDAITWTPGNNVITNIYRAVNYNSSANLFVVGGITPDNNFVLTSTNGSTWTSRAFGATFSVEAITNSGSLYIIAGSGGNIRTSTDTITWTARTSGVATNITNLAHNPSTVQQFLATGASAYRRTSTDGITWNTISDFPFSAAADSINCASANGLYFVYCDSSTTGRRVFVSRTGGSSTWAQCNIRPANNYVGTANTIILPTNIIYAGTQYFMCGSDMVGFSEDGINWVQYRVEFQFQSAVFLNGVYFGTTDQGIVRSYDGLNWTLVYYGISFTGGAGSRTINASNDFVVAAGQGSVIATSNLFTYNKTTEFALPQTTSLNLGTGTETLFIKAT
jgi:hypothetical protein